MSTSENTPADDQQIDRLYRTSQSTSPVDLDDSIRAAARSAQTSTSSTPSSYWNWQQRFGWATAAAVVLTSALFIALPETNSGDPLSAQSKRPVNPETPAVQSAPPVTQPSPEPLPEHVSVAAPVSTAAPPSLPAEVFAPPSADSLPQRSQVVAKKTQSLAIEAEPRRPIAAFSKNTRGISAAKTESLSQRQSGRRLEEVVMSDSVAAPQCQSLGDGLIERICSVPDTPNHFVAYPKQTALCGPLTLDKLRSPPLTDAASDADTFVYSVGKDAFAATCERGHWVIQSLARGR